MTFFRYGQKYFFRIYVGGAGVFCLLALVSLGLCVKDANKASSLDDQCIQCHIGMWNTAIGLPSQHLPFMDRQCTVCHLPENGAAPALQAAAASAVLFTGSAVSQEPQWAKRQVFKRPAGLGSEPRFVLFGLQPAVHYRFRVVNEDAAAKALPPRPAAIWLGLLPQEVMNAGQIDLPTLSLTMSAGGEVRVAWHGAVGSRAWVEVEEFGGGGAESLTGLAQPALAPLAASGAATKQPGGGHIPLRSPEETSIDLCYSCHSQSSLGTSHPVGIYSHGEDTIIPDELPTVVHGMLTCVTCHDPHAAVGKKLVREKVATKLCVACHVNFKDSSPSTMF